MYKNLSILSRKLHINIINLVLEEKSKFKRKIWFLMNGYEQWRINIIQELIACKENDRACELDTMELRYMLDY
ncbi:MAG: hypothetical protein AAGK97_19110, partial [Bacteroidota bacterium]